MDIVLIPGLWLDGSSWNAVIPVLERAGHSCHPITLPGLDGVQDPGSVSLADCVAAVTDVIDAVDGPVLLVGHSAGCGLAQVVLDVRVDKVARIVHIGGFPANPDAPLIGGVPTEDGGIPWPGWDAFEAEDRADLDDATLDAFGEAAIPWPASLATEVVGLADPRRHAVPATAICTEYSAADLVEWVESGQLAETDALTNLDFIDLPTGHWPQFTRAEELAILLAELAEVPRIDDHGRVEPPLQAGEARTAMGYLDYQRATLAWKARGLGEEGLRARVPSSELSLGGLLGHMALVEEHWLSYWLAGNEVGEPWAAVEWEADEDWDFHLADREAPEDVWALWNRAVRCSRAFVAGALARDGMSTPSAREHEGIRQPLRWILLHMIEEYARHNGHADLLREAVDGQTGE